MKSTHTAQQYLGHSCAAMTHLTPCFLWIQSYRNPALLTASRLIMSTFLLQGGLSVDNRDSMALNVTHIYHLSLQRKFALETVLTPKADVFRGVDMLRSLITPKLSTPTSVALTTPLTMLLCPHLLWQLLLAGCQVCCPLEVQDSPSATDVQGINITFWRFLCLCSSYRMYCSNPTHVLQSLRYMSSD